jgi:hypothetical protein
MGKAKFTSTEGCASYQSKAGEHTEQEVHSDFISHASLPLTLMDGFGFSIFTIGYLEKEARGVRKTLKQGGQENYFFSFIHMCIQCLGHFSSLPSAPSLSLPTLSLSPLPPHFQAETVLPLSLILLKREYKQ